MHTPTKQQFQQVINNLKSVLPVAKSKENFNMTSGYTFDPNGEVCGKVHCIGGWYAISKQLNLRTPGHAISYNEGAQEMAKDLGFSKPYQLEDWAIDRVDLWGNRYGGFMFCGNEAYDHAKTLTEAVNHLEGVMNRLPE